MRWLAMTLTMQELYIGCTNSITDWQYDINLFVHKHVSCMCPCTVDCGAPVIPSNVTVSDTSNTTEGATVTFQCEEGLIPSHLITITCTRNGNVGQWIPDPASIQCSQSMGNSSINLHT